MTQFAPGMQRGWRERRAKADRTDYHADERAAVRAIRDAAAAEKAAADRAAIAAQEAALVAARCECPVCRDGLVTLDLAERVIRALAKLPAGSPVDQDVLMSLQGAIVAQAAQAADPVADTRAVITPKSEPVILQKPRRKPTAAEIYAAGEDGVAELDD
ncbi:hypothetical protein JHFBIEKO_4806 [Methylobacterium mesophilicum]|uniref:hypothetical protein n=1 Tax=Methylobacterium mesophilicum TaxID=39956 RepID=UPI001EE15B6B|nr:hypothetical protein [Methylobacterium mesophilicum]GJE24334.1 hypothetical protein JHFBIEKO_4806 [Methylobacterium mesophilicum]